MSTYSELLSAADQEYILKEVGLVDLFPSDVVLNDDYTEVKVETPRYAPPVTNNLLSNEEYAGEYEFEVDIYQSGSKNTWVYSSLLNKVYMDIRSPFPVDFKVTNRPNIPLFIRVTPVYSALQYAHECVYRCLNHEYSTDPTMQNNRQHIIKCTNPNAQYLGDKHNERLSVVVPFSYPQTGAISVREMFEFLCKNSCPTPGMNRRAIEVIFTLEDSQENILGRRMLNVRVCSCPKRDKEKDEKELRTTGKEQPSRSKKRKLDNDKKHLPVDDSDDTKEYTITIPVAGKSNVQHILKMCHGLMAGEILRRANTGTVEPFQKCCDELDNLMKGMQE